MRIGIDLGGTKIEGIVLAPDGTELARRRVATPGGNYDATLETLVALIEDLERQCNARCSLGIGIPGTLSPDNGRVKNANSTCLNGKPLNRDLEARLQRPVRIANDADCFTLSEATDGAAAGANSVFGVILGTGVGGGVAIAGRLLAGPNAIAGEWGHNPLPSAAEADLPLPTCYCGRHGCLETYLSGPGLLQRYVAAGGETLQSVPALLTRAHHGEALARDVMAHYYDRLARGLATVINVVDPEVIVLGGGLSNIRALYREIPRRWGDYVFSDRVNTRLTPPRFGDSSGVRGAAWLWPLPEIKSP
ncbi:ROK family protein [Motiliproteus sp. SC1-56]|uniref:ROK family protein n=1 Tax=Motiliproteus sp. SC1-56 TaxID=2799565 RepID=UPI001A8C0596|nr:ROK family protein [Motiliproteus sp. SC1-56]